MELSSSTFKEKLNNLLANNKSVIVAMFVFGFVSQRKDKQGGAYLLKLTDKLFDDELRAQWDEETLTKARRGSEHISPTEEEERDPFPLSGILFVMRQLHKAIELKHPDWAVFYIIGEALARYNSDEISQIEFEYFLTQIPSSFMQRHIDIIRELCNFFNEKEKSLSMYLKEEKIIAYYS